jgi:class 3 adenylate cyclase
MTLLRADGVPSSWARLAVLGRVGASPGDTDEERIQKTLVVASTVMMASLAVLWGALYLAFGEVLAASIPLAYAVASFVSLALFAHIRRYELFRTSQLALSLVLPFFLMLSLGSFAASSAVILWSLTSPLGALVFAGRRPAILWFLAYVALILLGALLASDDGNELPQALITTLFVLNLVGVSGVAFVLLQYFVGEKDLAFTVLDRERRWIRDAFSTYISPNLVRHLLAHPEELSLGGERRECTFVLTDLEGFTSLVEQAEPEVVVGLLNEYLQGMTSIALAEDGTLDRIVGDAIAVMFSAPVVQSDHAERAVRCALAMDRFATSFAARQRARRLPMGQTRIGVCSGPVIVGHVGSDLRLDYRALGDPINTAQRLESANRYLGTRVCVATDTVARIAGFVGRRAGTLQLAGKSEPVEAWEALQPEAADSERLDRYEQAYSLMADGDPGALDAFRALERAQPDDALVGFHRRRLEDGLCGSVVDLSSHRERRTRSDREAAVPAALEQ